MIHLSVEKISPPFTKLISYRRKHKSLSNLLKETDFTPELENITRPAHDCQGPGQGGFTEDRRRPRKDSEGQRLSFRG